MKRPGLLARWSGSGDRDTEHSTIALLLPRYLVVAVMGERRGLHVRSIRLEDLSLEQALSAGVDSGVSATGMWSGETEAGSCNIGVGDDPDGRAFLAALRDAIVEAKSR